MKLLLTIFVLSLPVTLLSIMVASSAPGDRGANDFAAGSLIVTLSVGALSALVYIWS